MRVTLRPFRIRPSAPRVLQRRLWRGGAAGRVRGGGGVRDQPRQAGRDDAVRSGRAGELWGGRPEERLFAELLRGEEADVAARLAKEQRFDPDIWVVEIEAGSEPPVRAICRSRSLETACLFPCWRRHCRPRRSAPHRLPRPAAELHCSQLATISSFHPRTRSRASVVVEGPVALDEHADGFGVRELPGRSRRRS